VTRKYLLGVLITLFPVSGFAIQCDQANLPVFPDVQITSVSKETEPVALCKVAGLIGTEINFELLLPDKWNGKFAMGGGGAFVGSVQNAALNHGALMTGYATVGTDTGHKGHPIDASWALNNQERIVNFGHLAVHRTAVTAKALTRAYYGQVISRNYFIGCSRGGGQGLMSAQRYPQDFDGIVAGAPAYNWGGLAAQAVQIQQAMFPDPEDLTQALVTPGDQKILRQAILAQCDSDDGIRDGILNNPVQCDFKIESLNCNQQTGSDAQRACLSTDKISAIRAIYDGPGDDNGALFYGYPFGGESEPAGWSRWLTGGAASLNLPSPDGQQTPYVPNLMYGLGVGIMKYMVFHDPEWDYASYDFKDFRRNTVLLDASLTANDPDLSEFRRRGGKLLLFHGWSDPAITALGTIGYFREVSRHDPDAAEDVRLFMMPGMLHCNGGKGPTHANFLAELDNWLESGTPPEEIEAFYKNAEGKHSGSRPLCAYPKVAIYDGIGDSRDSASFTCDLPQ
jgi:feruloyl esterase